MGPSVGPNTLKLRQKKKKVAIQDVGQANEAGGVNEGDETACGDSPWFKQKTLQFEKDASSMRTQIETYLKYSESCSRRSRQYVRVEDQRARLGTRASRTLSIECVECPPRSSNAWEQFDRLRTAGVWSQKATTVVRACVHCELASARCDWRRLETTVNYTDTSRSS